MFTPAIDASFQRHGNSLRWCAALFRDGSLVFVGYFFSKEMALNVFKVDLLVHLAIASHFNG